MVLNKDILLALPSLSKYLHHGALHFGIPNNKSGFFESLVLSRIKHPMCICVYLILVIHKNTQMGHVKCDSCLHCVNTTLVRVEATPHQQLLAMVDLASLST